MKTSRGNEPTSVSVPPDLLAQAQAVADEEHRTTDDVVREAVERYLSDRRWQRVLAYGQERTQALGLMETDVLRLVAEARQERRREQAGD